MDEMVLWKNYDPLMIMLILRRILPFYHSYVFFRVCYFRHIDPLGMFYLMEASIGRSFRFVILLISSKISFEVSLAPRNFQFALNVASLMILAEGVFAIQEVLHPCVVWSFSALWSRGNVIVVCTFDVLSLIVITFNKTKDAYEAKEWRKGNGRCRTTRIAE